jgi:general secretion pathway protein G
MRTCLTILVIFTSVLGVFTCCGRPDTVEELYALRVLDVIFGLFVAVAVVLNWLSNKPGIPPKWGWVAGPTVIVVWALVSGSLLLWHDALCRVRWSAGRTIAYNRVKMAQLALQDYAKDCGRFPSQEQGLRALYENPGVKKWAGPYLEEKDLTDPWGNPLQYKVHNNRIDVWSLGKDGQDGTPDDIRLESLYGD